jgi:hypothetical protein
MMKPEVVLVNTSRGEIVHIPSLLEALGRFHSLAGYLQWTVYSMYPVPSLVEALGSFYSLAGHVYKRYKIQYVPGCILSVNVPSLVKALVGSFPSPGMERRQCTVCIYTLPHTATTPPPPHTRGNALRFFCT